MSRRNTSLLWQEPSKASPKTSTTQDKTDSATAGVGATSKRAARWESRKKQSESVSDVAPPSPTSSEQKPTVALWWRPRLTIKRCEGLHIMLSAGPPINISMKGLRRYQEAEKWIKDMLAWRDRPRKKKVKK